MTQKKKVGGTGVIYSTLCTFRLAALFVSPLSLSASLSFPLFLIYQQADLIYQQAGAHRCNPLLLLYTGSDGSVMW